MNRTERNLIEEKIKVKHMGLIIGDYENSIYGSIRIIKEHQTWLESKGYDTNTKMHIILGLLESAIEHKPGHKARLSAELNRTFKKGVKGFDNDFKVVE